MRRTLVMLVLMAVMVVTMAAAAYAAGPSGTPGATGPKENGNLTGSRDQQTDQLCESNQVFQVNPTDNGQYTAHETINCVNRPAH